MSFLHLSDRSDRQEQAGNMTSPKIHERLVVTPRSTVRSCRSMSCWRASARPLLASARPLLASARRQIETSLIFSVQTIVDFALSLPGYSL